MLEHHQLIYDEIKGNPHLRPGQSVAQTPAHAPTDARRVSITSMGMDIETGSSALGESLEQEDLSQGIDGLAECYLTGLGSYWPIKFFS